MKKLDVILVGAGGYGGTYVDMMLNKNEEQNYNFKAVVDPYVKNAASYKALTDANILLYDSLTDFFAHNTTDLTIVSTPINLHMEHCVAALENDSHVLCEKPVLPTVAQLETLERRVKESKKILTVGFQWAFSDIMLRIKNSVLSGDYGKAISMKTYVSWPRDWNYYKRGWAGKLFDRDGNFVLDSIASNATSHYIFNMLFMLGKNLDEAAGLDFVIAETYRANAIESYDTIAFKGKTTEGVDIFYSASHAVNCYINPIFVYEFEKATVTLNYFDQNDLCIVHHKSGLVENIGKAFMEADANKLLHTFAAIRGEKDATCMLKTVKPHVQLINGIYDNVETVSFAEETIIKDGETQYTYVPYLHMDLHRCFLQKALPSEIGFDWAKKAAYVPIGK